MPTVSARGLADVVASPSAICYIDGERGVLAYRGYDIHDLAERSSFIETAYLLWRGQLPTQAALDQLRQDLEAAAQLPEPLVNWMRQIPPSTAPMDVLRTLVSALGLYDAEAGAMSVEANQRKAIRLLAQTPMLVAAWERIRHGQPRLEPDPALSLPANFLYQLTGKRPSPTAERALDIALILHADHEFNASTFAARVTAATLSDLHSAVTAALGALKGPLHGGANEAVIRLLLELHGGDPVEMVSQKLAAKQKIPGFGHRVYHTEDPRATHLRQMAQQLAEASGHEELFQASRRIEQYINREKHLNANVDFYSATVYYSLGIAPDLYTPVFAISRMSGWTVHVLEQYSDNRLIRPRADYTGPHVPLPYNSIDLR